MSRDEILKMLDHREQETTNVELDGSNSCDRSVFFSLSK